MDIAGSVVLVTGANRGIGAAFVNELLARGASKVYAGMREPVPSEDPRVVPIALDITDEAQVFAAAASAADVAIVINNAGVSVGGSLLTASDTAGARQDMDTNYFGTLNIARAFAPVLKTNGGGTLVNVLSVLSWFAMPQAGSYCASKSAAWSMTNSLRVELAEQGTHVLAAHFGAVDTDMGASLSGPKNDPRDIAASVVQGIVDGAAEVLADGVSTIVRGALSADLSALYPSVVPAPAAPEPVATEGGLRLDPSSLETAGEFVTAAGLIVDEVTPTTFVGHIDVDERHHTPWGIVHGGVYATAIESAASIAASAAVRDDGLVAVGLTNTTHFLRSITAGRANVTATALNQGRTQQLWQVDVLDERGKRLAHGEVRLQNLPVG